MRGCVGQGNEGQKQANAILGLIEMSHSVAFCRIGFMGRRRGALVGLFVELRARMPILRAWRACLGLIGNTRWARVGLRGRTGGAAAVGADLSLCADAGHYKPPSG